MKNENIKFIDMEIIFQRFLAFLFTGIIIEILLAICFLLLPSLILHKWSLSNYEVWVFYTILASGASVIMMVFISYYCIGPIYKNNIKKRHN